MDVYLEEIVLFGERIINMITKSMGDIMVLYPIITKVICNTVLSQLYSQLMKSHLV